MSHISSQMAVSEEVVMTAITDLKNGKIRDAIARFSDKFRFKDYGLGLEFTDIEQLGEFFQKTRELYPDSVLRTETIFLSGDHVITEWTLQTILTESFYGLTRRVPISLHGTSSVRTENGLITHWVDYYDGLNARRTALASYFTEWIEL
jgi:hypothetical protein